MLTLTTQEFKINRIESKSYLNEYLGKFIRVLILMFPKMRGYIKTFKVQGGDKDKSNKLLSLRIDGKKTIKQMFYQSMIQIYRN